MQEMDKFLENRNFSISLFRILIHYKQVWVNDQLSDRG